MLSEPELGVSATRAASSSQTRRPRNSFAGIDFWLPAAASAVLLFLLDSLTRPVTGPSLWSPVAGLGLVLTAWVGWRFGLVALSGAGLLMVARQLFRLTGSDSAVGFLWVFVEAALLTAGPLGAWYLVRDLVRDSRLLDPRSAILFGLLAPGVAAGLTAVLHAGFAVLLQRNGDSF